MMKQFKHFVGIDVSKETLDVCVIFQDKNRQSEHMQIANSKSGINQLLRYLKKEKLNLLEVLFCLEHTGLYGAIAINALLKRQSNVWVEMPYTIKHSMGIQRGKSDKVDSHRIAQYAFRFQDKAQLYRPTSSNLERIKSLLSLREKLVKAAKGLNKHLTELKKFDPESYKLIRCNIKSSVDNLKKNIRVLDGKMDKIVREDLPLK